MTEKANEILKRTALNMMLAEIYGGLESQRRVYGFLHKKDLENTGERVPDAQFSDAESADVITKASLSFMMESILEVHQQNKDSEVMNGEAITAAMANLIRVIASTYSISFFESELKTMLIAINSPQFAPSGKHAADKFKASFESIDYAIDCGYVFSPIETELYTEVQLKLPAFLKMLEVSNP